MASEKCVRERIPESYEMTSEECSAMLELEELDNRPTEQMTPARALWYGCGRIDERAVEMQGEFRVGEFEPGSWGLHPVLDDG